MQLTCVQKYDKKDLRRITLPDGLAGYTVLSKYVLYGYPVLRFWTEKEINDLPDNRDLQRHILSSAIQIEDRCCSILPALAEYAGITDAFEIVRVDKGKYCICPEKTAREIRNVSL
ncbi:MAG: hypothetical protein LUH20_03735 [Lachnospiraceae bacterium]|nr:hypothetical protein [Lachnospiraceae bacterium]